MAAEKNVGSSGVRQSATGRRRSSSDVAHGRSVFVNIKALIMLQVQAFATKPSFFFLVIMIAADVLQLATV